MPTLKPINAVWKLVPAGKGMSVIQSEPLPTEDAQLRLDDLDKEEEPGKPEETEAEATKEPMPMPRPKQMPPFGKQAMPPGGPGGPEDMEAMMAGARSNPFQKRMPPFAGM